MKVKLISSLEKCFLDESISDKKEYKKGSCFKNELFHFCVCYQAEDERSYPVLTVESEISDYVRVSRIEVVPVQHAFDRYSDDYFLRKTPGLYPDVMQPIGADGRLIAPTNLKALMVEVDSAGKVPAGIYPITFCFNEYGQECRQTFELEIIDAFLPKQETVYTQWFYCDCLMNYYETEAFDDRHFEIIENFAKTAVRYGVNMLLTPVFTPALDTYISGERPTTQLVGVTKNGGEYSFDFSLLGRFIDMCDRVGVEYFEISHFFTQWGASAAPKVMATVDGEYKKIFGWETDASGAEYSGFLREFIPALLGYMKARGDDKRCYFHISDEPHGADQMENYLKAKAVVAPLLEGYVIMDALSDYEFYSRGIVEHPVVAISDIETFIENGVSDLWGYYCVGQNYEVSNRFIAMPSHRNRIIGTQIYKYGLKGFLQWGYNFYNNQLSYAAVNPFMSTDAEYFGAAGDAFSVYPGPGGKPWESIRLLVFYDALQDVRAFKLCEQLCGRDYVMNILEENTEPITFRKYPRNDDYLLNVREKINQAVKAALK